ncbi:MAG: hypothetical protein HY323_09205 [Betaproteobacteria bacterium]|nr:hypothetical protein [Betaproteobacteria bacterium]
MPVKERAGQEIKGFLGVNLRRERLDLADEELAKAINADLHTQPGAIVVRLGRSKQFSTALTDLAIRRLARINGKRYQVAGQSLYRDQTRILNGLLSANLFTTLMPFRPLNDTTTWAFIADDAIMRKDNGTTVHLWGIAVPSVAPTILIGLTSGSLSGSFTVRVTGVRFDGAKVAHEGNPTVASASVTVASEVIAIGDLIHADPQVNGTGIYRTVNGGASHLLDLRAAYPVTSQTGVTLPLEAGGKGTGLQFQWSIPLGSISVGRAWGSQDWEPTGEGNSEDAAGRRATHLWEITDAYVTTQTKRWAYGSITADSALGAAVETDNDVPPLASWVTAFQEHAFLCRDAANPHYLWWSKRFRPESMPLTQFLEIGNPDDPLQCALPLAGMLGAFTRLTKYRVLGNATSGFTSMEAISRRGTPAAAAAITTEHAILFLARDGIFRTNLLSPDDELSELIAPLFFGETVNGISPINWAAISTAGAAYWKGRYYTSLPLGTATVPIHLAVYSFDTKRFYFFDHPCRSLFTEEATDTLTAGFTDGFVYILEDGAADGDAGGAIILDAETKNYSGGMDTLRKMPLWLRVDADTQGETLSVELYVDDTLRRTASLSGLRTKALIPFPDGSLGYSWRARFRYTGKKRVRIYGVSALWLPLEAA